MADITRSTGIMVLPVLLAAPLPVWSDETAVAAPSPPCVAQPGQPAPDCAAATAAVRPAADTGQPAPPAGQRLGPSAIDAARQPLVPLAPTPRAGGGDTTGDLPRQTPHAGDEATVAVGGPAPPPADPARQEARVHAGLNWDYCGPKPGVEKLAVTAPFRSGNEIPIDITADHAEYDRELDVIHLLGGVQMVQQDRRLDADRSNYDRASGAVDAQGNVFMEAPGLRLAGDRADYNLGTKQGSVDQAHYRMSGNANLRGQADKAWLISETLSRYRDIIYTTCPPGSSDWSIRASDLELDQASGIGKARHARIRIADIPVLYSPYLEFPIDNRRRSGFLIPAFGVSSKNGVVFSQPYYWNIAPNMDATITPTYMGQRGLMLGTEFRWLTKRQNVEFYTEILPRDNKEPDEGIRGALRIKENGNLGPRWSTSIDYSAVSDDTYLQDFGNRLDVTSLRNLSRRGDLNYNGDGWNLLTRVQEFQTVDNTIAPANRPYGQLPHIEFNLNPKLWQGLEYSFEGDYDYFDHDSAVHGNRVVAIPSLRLPLRRSYGYLTPRARVYYTAYDLVDQEAGLPSTPSHVIPSVDLDGKLVFERQGDWFGGKVLQTLEPRLYYVYTPYEDQSDTPRFDTTALDFSFASLFRPNRFTGYDRIGDENRLTLGLTSRTMENASGEEIFRASIGQIYYFENRRVQLTGDAVDSDISSSVAGELSARLFSHWTALTSLQWNPNQTKQPWEKQVLQLRYSPDNQRLLNLAYRYNLGTSNSEQYEDADISFQTPLGPNTRIVGRWLYSLLNDETVEAVAGIEFGRCCWRFRILGEHLKRNATSSASNSIMLQLELVGLGAFGNNIDKLLERGIYGYHSD